VEIEETVRFIVESRQPESMADLVFGRVPVLRDLVTFATQEPAPIRWIGVSGPSTVDPDRPDRPQPCVLALLASMIPRAGSIEPAPLRRSMFRFPSDEREFRRLMMAWFDAHNRLRPVLDLRFSSTYAGFVFGETRFLNAVQAVEALHRRLLPNEPRQADLDAKQAVIDACPAEYRTWVERKLRFAHEPTLRTRLSETLDYIGPAIAPLVPERALFLQTVVAARNDLTHWDVNGPARDGESLRGLSMIVEYVVDAALLRVLGWSEEELTRTLALNEHYQWVAKTFALTR